MALGALSAFGGHIAVAVTGIAGPDGGQPGKPVGTVWFAWARHHMTEVAVHVAHEIFAGDREAVRRATVDRALSEILRLE
jgi:nicotinamide-nucleotide amidase